MSDTEFYNADNLFEKIDGRAPAYLNFNFQNLRCRSFSLTGTPGSFVDVYEYRFDTPINAFGMFALERDPQGGPLDFAPDGYASGMGFFFRQGPRYIQVMASDQNAKTLGLAKAIAEDRAKNLPADDTGLDARRRLPATGLDPASVQFVQENAQGQAFLKNVFQANYDFAGKKLPFFLMVTTPADGCGSVEIVSGLRRPVRRQGDGAAGREWREDFYRPELRHLEGDLPAGRRNRRCRGRRRRGQCAGNLSKNIWRGK